MNDEFQDEPPSRSPKTPRRIALRPITIILFLTMTILGMMIMGWPYLQARYNLPWSPPISLLPDDVPNIESLPPSETPAPFQTLTPSATLPLLKTDPERWSQGLIVLSLQEGLDTHLFAYQPLIDPKDGALPLTRLTSGSWQDITPALSPQEDRLAFASNRNGFWNIYLLDLLAGEVTQVTNSPDFAASPSWSPDGLWMAYEAHIEESLDIYIQPVDGSQDPIQLTSHPSADSEPAWAPDGRRIAFVSARSGRNQVWLANLDESGSGRFQLLSGEEEMVAAHPAWSRDGHYLVWSAVMEDGLHRIFRWDSRLPEGSPVDICSGDWAAWSPDGESLMVVFNTPYESYLTAYPLDVEQGILMPPIKLPGEVSGLVWMGFAFSGDLLHRTFPTLTPLWQDHSPKDPVGFEGRWELVALTDVEAPYARLHDRVDESFQALRIKLANLVGWDLLADLENAFLPLSSALSPGLLEDWLYTGRAFAVNTLPVNAGWMTVVREDFGQETYWRVYLRARFQDGSQGQPLARLPWDFNARYSGVPKIYEQGGAWASIVPPGYWVDMTRIAAAYGWQRLAALSTWRVAYPSARFNEFAFTEGLTWEAAMLEIYPPEVLLTLTPFPTPTTSTTPAPLWYRSPTPTMTHSQSPTSTLSASQTPASTPTATRTPQESPSRTPEPSMTLSPTGTKTPTP